MKSIRAVQGTQCKNLRKYLADMRIGLPDVWFLT